jgi:translocation and assembly module TamB
MPTDLRRHRRGTAWDERVARVVCVFLAIVGVLPFAGTVVFRSALIRDWAARESQGLLRNEGIVASYSPRLRLWPLAVELDHVRVDSTDRGDRPALECERILVRPKLFALLSGKLVVDEIDLDEPRLRAVFRAGRIVSLRLPEGPPSTGPSRAPFTAIAVTEGLVDLDVDGIRIDARSIDLDATAEDDPVHGSSFELAFRTGAATVHRERQRSDTTTASDDDALCSAEGRVRVDPDAILVRRFSGVGAADLDAQPGSPPPCDVPSSDKRRVELSLGHFRVQFPKAVGELPRVDGHLHARMPLALAERATQLPETDGWVGIDADVRYDRDTIIPDVKGVLEAHDIRVGQYAFADDLKSEIVIRRNIVESPTTTIRLASGSVVLTGTVVDPLSHGGRLERTRLDVAGVDFTALLRALGVHPHSWVAWDVREIHAPFLSGSFAPLRIDGDFTAKTYAFGVYDRPAEDPSRQRLVGFSEAQLAAHLGIRPDAIKFMDVHAKLPHSQIDGGFVSIGFHNDLRVDVPKMRADLDDISPIGSVPMRGVLEATARVNGTFSRPEPEGDITSATAFSIADLQLGDMSAGHVKVDTSVPEVDITAVHAKKGPSPYEVPTAKLRFGGSRGFVVDAVAATDTFWLRDLLSMFALDDDPRFDGLNASIGTRSRIHVAVGGPEDLCGAGYVTVDAKGQLADVTAFGERFEHGSADMTLRWFDRERGIAGADVDVRSFALEKTASPTGDRAGAVGTVLGSASIRSGGDLAANVIFGGVPLSRVNALGSFASQVEGNMSGVAHVTGQLDAFRPSAGVVARTQLDIVGTRLRGVAVGDSHLDVRLTHKLDEPHGPAGRTKCNAPIPPPFDKTAYANETGSRGDWNVNGSLLGETVLMDSVSVTRERYPHATGRVSLRALDLGGLLRALAPRDSTNDSEAGSGASAISGELSGDLIADDVSIFEPAKSRARFILGPTQVRRGGQTWTLKPPSTPILVEADALTLPPLEVTLETKDGFRGGFVLTGGATKISSEPELAIEADLAPIDMAILPSIVSDVERASGRVQGSLRITGHARSPILAGELHAVADDIEIHGLPSAVTDVRLDARANSDEITASASGKFAGGTVAFEGTLPLHGFVPEALDSRITARSVHLTPIEGVTAAFDADLALTYERKENGAAAASLPRVTGDITLATFSYTRPVTFNLDLTSTRAKRTKVDAYDPALDFIGFDVRVRSRTPLVMKNNLVEVQLAIESGTLEVTGSNQRVGLRGVLRTLAGGRFHFQASEFEVQQGFIRFEDPTRVAPNVDITAVTEYRRYTDSSAGAAAGAGAGVGPTAASTSSTRGGSLWRITLHAFGDADNVRIEMTSEPALSQEDIVLLLMVGMTRAELDQLQASGIGESVALNVLGAASGADRAVKQALPIIDDFRFGSAYSTVTGKTEPQLTVGKRLTNNLRASVTAGLSEDRELRSDIEWRLNNKLSVQGSYDNINDVSSSTLGNLGVDLRWRFEFE